MLQKIREYAKGIAGAVGLAATAVAPALPVDSAAQLYVGIAAAVAGLVAVVCIPNARPADDAAAARTALERLETLPILKAHAATLAKLADVVDRLAVATAASENVTHDPVAGGVGDVPAAVADAPSLPVAAVPADPSPVVADGDSAAEIPAPPAPPVGPPDEAPAEPVPAASSTPTGVDDGVTLPDDVPPPTVGILTS